jgi:hypothetical protein
MASTRDLLLVLMYFIQQQHYLINFTNETQLLQPLGSKRFFQILNSSTEAQFVLLITIFVYSAIALF